MGRNDGDLSGGCYTVTSVARAFLSSFGDATFAVKLRVLVLALDMIVEKAGATDTICLLVGDDWLSRYQVPYLHAS